jgi:hypothetical protein
MQVDADEAAVVAPAIRLVLHTQPKATSTSAPLISQRKDSHK